MSGQRSRNNQRRNGKLKYMPPFTIVLIIGFLGVIMFTFIYALSNTTPKSDENETPDNSAVVDSATDEGLSPAEVPASNDNPEEGSSTEQPDDQHEDEQPDVQSSFIVSKDITDISTGNLLLVNPDHFYDIPEDINLARISDIGSSAIRLQIESFQLLEPAILPLDDMMTDFLSETGNRTVTVIAAFRTHATQRTMQERHGSRAANPGHSEHHTGLAFDFGIFIGGERSVFTGTGVTAWFQNNSYRYGFIARYPADKTHITMTEFEPWHYRYVGLPHSHIIYENNWAFEEYIEAIKAYSFEAPYRVDIDGASFDIYFSSDTDIMVPVDVDFDISGNNVDGFIVTVVRDIA